jgi:uncharacterized protein (DUF488 family)
MDLTVYTIGHSNHGMRELLDLLRMHRIEEVVDVRSRPVSGYCPHFDKRRLQVFLEKAGLAYSYLGRELGGMPEDPDLRDGQGRVRYERLRETPVFKKGLERLLQIAKERRPVLMCAEENPARCHRCLAIGASLTDRGVAVLHIRKDGGVQTQQEITRGPEAQAGQLDLF